MVHRRSPNTDAESALGLLRFGFFAAATTCLLLAVHRAAAALTLTARVQALRDVDEALTVDEREALIRSIKAGALSRRGS